MFGKAQLKTNGRDPSRVLLSNAIRSRGEIEARLQAARLAAERVQAAYYDAQTRIEAARVAAANAHDAQVSRLVEGETGVIERPVRSAEQDAADDLAAAKIALARVRDRIAEDEKALYLAARRVEDAVGEVLAAEAGKLIEEAAELREEFLGQLAVLRFASSGMSEADRRRVDRLSLTSDSSGPHPLLTLWQAAAAQLARAADAPLPGAGEGQR